MFGGYILVFLAELLAATTTASLMTRSSQPMHEAREIPVELYISDSGRDAFLSKGKSIEAIADDVATKLETKINEQVSADKNSPDKRPYKFIINVASMMPHGVDLDMCGDRTVSFVNDLNIVTNERPGTSVILFYTCNSNVYNPEFKKAGQDTPLIVQRVSTECSNKIATFVEPEPMKIEAILANALFAAAGSPLDNAVAFEEVADGNDGFKRDIRITNEGFLALSGACYAN